MNWRLLKLTPPAIYIKLINVTRVFDFINLS